MKKSPSTPAIPSWPLVALCGALGMLALPLWEHAASWTVIFFWVCLVVRLALNFKSFPLPPAWAKLSILAISTGVILADYGSLVDVESAFGILMILIGLKMCEANRPRDLQVLTLLGCFLALCDLFFEQDLSRWLFVGFALTLVFSARIFFYQANVERGFLRSNWQTLKLLGQAVPLTLLLFVFFPRIYGDFKLILRSSSAGATGMSEKLAPGSIASLASRGDVAFRVSFPDKNTPPAPQLYWRGIVLWDGNGLLWDRGGHDRLEQKVTGLSGPPIRQHITLKPYGDTWLFALDRPSTIVKNAAYQAGGALRNSKQFYTELPYDVVSYPENHQLTLDPVERAAAMRKPVRVSQAVQELADSFRSGTTNDEVVVSRALAFFKVSGFSYSLSPGVYLSAELDEFLFRRKIGFCEHYASAFASLMRLAGVPSRIVLGYQGGEYSDVGNYMIVRQSDAHAWCEVYIRNKGWVRVDPTSAIAPERVTTGLQSVVDNAERATAESAGPAAITAWRGIARFSRLYWDNLSYQWNLHVLSFDRDSQINFLAVLGILNWDNFSIGTALAFVCVILLGGLLVWLRRTPSAARGDAAQRWYTRYLRRLAKAGINRNPAEGPLTLADRAGSIIPAHASTFRRIGELYAALRYSAQPPPIAEFATAIRTLPKLPPSSYKSPRAVAVPAT